MTVRPPRYAVDDMNGQFERFRVSDERLKTLKSKKVRGFYENQNAILVNTPLLTSHTFVTFYHIVGDIRRY